MTRFLLITWLLMPMSLALEVLPERVHANAAFTSLLMTCMHGGNASIWINNEPIAYVTCKREPFPRRFPK